MSVDAIIDREFPHAEDLVYLNHAAVAPWPARTAEAVRRFAEENATLGASRYPEWVKQEQILREQLRAFINAPSAEDIALLKNTSEALSVIACGLDWRWGDNVVTTAEEFPSNRIPWQAQRKWGVALREVPLSGENPEQALMEACDARTRLLTVSWVQYGSGIRLDLPRLGAFCRERGILFCVDAIQGLGALQFDVQTCRADFVTADAHKWMLGPEGIALFYCRADLRCSLELRQFGWHMVQNAGDYESRDWRPAADARRFECGSPNTLGVHALSASLSLLIDIGMDEVARRVLKNTTYLIEQLNMITGTSVRTPELPQRRAGIVSFVPPGGDVAGIHKAMQERGVLCAARAGALRFSPHFYIDEPRLDKALQILREVL